MLRMTCALLLMVSFTAAAEDSPLVSLAKRTNRKESKTKVITNETLAASTMRGRLSVASETPNPVPTISVQTAPTITVRVTSQTAATPRVNNDPPLYPPSSARSIDPSSSARTLTPETSARPAVPAAAQSLNPQSSNQPVAPPSSAQNITPQSAQSQRPPQ